MADNVSPAVRTRTMRRIKSKGMKPEMLVRRLVHGMGYRYRLHRNDLPGRPDLVFVSRRKIVQVNGCFWHNHSGCAKVRIPATNREYWISKLSRNKARDEHNLTLLSEKGWQTLVLWECELDDIPALTSRVVAFLDPPPPLV